MLDEEKSIPKKQEDKLKFNIIEKQDYNTFEELIEQNAGLSFEKLMVFEEIIGANSWEINIQEGEITFGDLKFPVQLIGTYAFNDNSWMWAWANTQSSIPENLLILANKLKEIGGNKNIKELSEGCFNIEEGFLHEIGMASCGLFNSKTYYCGNYGQGVLVVIIDDERIPEINKNRFEKIMTSFPQLMNRGMKLNHKNTFKNYLLDRDFKLSNSEDRVEGMKDEKVIVAEFDELNRLKSLNGEIKHIE